MRYAVPRYQAPQMIICIQDMYLKRQHLDSYAATTPHREKLLLLFVVAGYVRNVADD